MDLLLIALAVFAGVDRSRLALLACCLHLPWVLAGAIAVLVAIRPRHRVNRAALFCHGVASELRSGSPLRQALSASAGAVGAPMLAVRSRDEDLAVLGGVIAEEFPLIGRELAVTVARAAHTGGPTADLFDEIGSLAIAHEEIRREVGVASAPARAAAVLFIGFPLVYLGWRWGSGDLAALLATPEQQSIAGIGLTLFLVGLLGAALVMWRAR